MTVFADEDSYYLLQELHTVAGRGRKIPSNGGTSDAEITTR